MVQLFREIISHMGFLAPVLAMSYVNVSLTTALNDSH